MGFIVLWLCFHSNTLKNPVFVLCCRSKMLQKHWKKKQWFYCLFDQKVAFLVKILVPKCTKRNKVNKPLCFIWTIVKQSNFALFYCVFFHSWPRKGARQRPATRRKTIILQMHLGNRNRSLISRPPARSHERNETISRLGALRTHPPKLRSENTDGTEIWRLAG